MMGLLTNRPIKRCGSSAILQVHLLHYCTRSSLRAGQKESMFRVGGVSRDACCSVV